VREFIDAGFKAIVVCVNEQFLEKSFCGRIFNQSFLNDLPDTVDDCGENGEFHTFVFDGPIFNYPIRATTGEIVYKEYKAPGNVNSVPTPAKSYGFYFCDLLGADVQTS
jgi:diphthamide synthase (EF-2-diphthine--ammonia ligase)